MGNMASQTVNQMAFVPPPPTYRKQDVNMWLETDKGNRIPCFHIRKGYPITMLVSHANAEDLGIVLAFWSWMSDALQVDVFAYEYSGYGHSGGTPSEDNMYSDARAALKLLTDGFKLKPERDIVLYGKSLGSCPTCYLASTNRVRGVVIVSGLASGARVLFPNTKVFLMDMLYFHNIGKLSSCKSATQIIHGTRDEVVPFSNGADLHDACRRHHPLPPCWIDGAMHNNLETVYFDARAPSRHALHHPPLPPTRAPSPPPLPHTHRATASACPNVLPRETHSPQNRYLRSSPAHTWARCAPSCSTFLRTLPIPRRPSRPASLIGLPAAPGTRRVPRAAARAAALQRFAARQLRHPARTPLELGRRGPRRLRARLRAGVQRLARGRRPRRGEARCRHDIGDHYLGIDPKLYNILIIHV